MNQQMVADLVKRKKRDESRLLTIQIEIKTLKEVYRQCKYDIMRIEGILNDYIQSLLDTTKDEQVQ